MTNVLVVAAHPDDEVLGCGGTLIGHKLAGDTVQIMYMTNGVGARGENVSEIERRQQSALSVSRSLGCELPDFFDFTDNQMDTHPFLDIVKAVETVVHRERPDVIYTHFGGDLNIDHILTYRAVLTACRPQPGCSVKAIYCFEVSSSTEWAPQAYQSFNPQRFVDIGAFKQQLDSQLLSYQQELRPWPHCRSVEAIWAHRQWRGASVGLAAAEAFMVEREIIN